MKKLILILILVLIFSCKKKESPPPDKTNVNTSQLEVKEVVGIANIEPMQRIVQLSSEASGAVTELKVNLNDHVRKGQPLLLLDAAVEAAQVAQAQSKIRTQQAVIQSQQSTVDALRVNLADAKNKFERNERLFKANAVTQQTRDDSKFAYDNLTLQVKAGEDNIAQQKAKLNELQADLNYYKTLLNRKTITAPTDGTILSIEVKIGSYVDSKTSVGDFAPSGPLIAVTEIDELFADKVQVGQTAYIRAQGDTVVQSTGKVILTAPYLKKKSLFSDNANNLEDRRVREVRVQLDDEKVLIGSRVECVIKLR
ncbi:MAG: efflux RND transporter periplasmic adaptor subunit [Bacteroidetes bacterium]|nr:efflux RND transporter periplasmic adaptor subunit [Bacteroidota bacterium]